MNLNKPTDPRLLAAFRAIFGLLMATYVFGFHTFELLKERYLSSNFFFSFDLFHYLNLKAWGPYGMQVHFTIMGIAACFICLGFLYRVACITFFVCLSYIFLLEKTYSPNPIYLYIIITFLLIFTEANKAYSIDSIRRGRGVINIPSWNYWILKLQFVICYFYSGISKAFHNDWLEAKQARIWLSHYFDSHPQLSHFFNNEIIYYIYSYSGLIFDLLIGFLLINKKTRCPAIFIAACFHLTNKVILDLGIFPYVMLSTLLVFFDPDNFNNLILKTNKFLKLSLINIKTGKETAPINHQKENQKLRKFVLIVFFSIQLLFPFRHFLYPHDVNWTQIGQAFSWHFMNNNMDAKIKYIDHTFPENIRDFNPILLSTQQRWFMGLRPDTILDYSHQLCKSLTESGVKDPEVFVKSVKSLNGRPYQDLIDSNYNLCNAKLDPFKINPWIKRHPTE